MKRILVGMFLQMVYTVFCLAESNIGVLQASHTGYSGADDVYQLWGWNIGEFYQFNLSSCIRQQNSLTAQFVSFSLSNLANIFYPPQFLQ